MRNIAVLTFLSNVHGRNLDNNIWLTEPLTSDQIDEIRTAYCAQRSYKFSAFCTQDDGIPNWLTDLDEEMDPRISVWTFSD